MVFSTKKFVGICSVAVDLVSQKISFFDEENGAQERSRRSLLDDYLLNPKLDLADVVGVACDILMTGIDTVFQHKPFFSTSFHFCCLLTDFSLFSNLICALATTST